MAVKFAAPTVQGAGTGSDAGNAYLISNFLATAAPADTLNLVDGTYTGSSSMIAPPAGIAGATGAPITIQAINDGGVLIDGQFARRALNLSSANGNHYFDIEGVNCAHGFPQNNLVAISSNNNILRRICAWDSTNGSPGNSYNAMVFGISSTAANNLLEDCAGWGWGRKVFEISQGPNANTLRRCLGRWEGSINVGPKGVFELDYGASNSLAENCIGLWSGAVMPSTYQLINNGAVFASRTSIDSKSITTGSVTFNTVGGSGATFAVGSMRMRAFRHSAPTTYMEGLVTGNAGNTVTINVNLTGGSGGPFTDWDLNKVFINNGVDQPTSTFTPAFNEAGPTTVLGSIGIVLGSDTFAGISGYYGIGCSNRTYRDDVFYFAPATGSGKTTFSFNNTGTGNSATNMSSFKGGSNGSSIAAAYSPTNVIDTALEPSAFYNPGESLYNTTRGAQIRYRYVNGVLTSTPLFPWPMSSRIAAATAASGHTPLDVDAMLQGIFGTYLDPVASGAGVWFTS